MSQLALVRCDAGKPFNSGIEEQRESLDLLRKLELIEGDAWRCTELGHWVVGYLCGDVYRAPRSSKFDGTGHTMADAVADSPHTLCTECQGSIPAGTHCIWVQGSGLFHIDCVEQPS